MTLRIATCLTVALVSVACGGAEITDEINPPSATPEQVAAFCDRLDEVRDREIGAMFEALLDLAPPELETALTRLTGAPGETYWDDRETVEDYMERCD